MIKHTLFFGSPAYLSRKHSQLCVEPTDPVLAKRLVPIEDIGVLVLDHPQITLTHALLQALMAEGAAVVTSNEQHLPDALLLPMTGHTLHQARLQEQVEASLPLKKQLWRQTVQTKIMNQAAVLALQQLETANMRLWASRVKSGDPENLEGRAAAYYWRNLFGAERFRRSAEGGFPNNWLNYGYAILRAVIARAIVGAGLHPAMGLHHRNQYNPYTLADDLMEPYRPYVDRLVWNAVKDVDWAAQEEFMTRDDKALLLTVPALPVEFGTEELPLMMAAQRTAVSLTRCFAGEGRKLAYPMDRLFNPYHVMWVMVFFDLPTETKADRRAYSVFRKKLLHAGFDMFQFSIYVRHCLSRDNAERHVARVKDLLPQRGLVGILTITDKQFGDIELFNGRDTTQVIPPKQQLELF